MDKAQKKYFANPSSIHRDGLLAKGVLDGVRTRVARILGSKAGDVVFTGSGTEAINLALGAVDEGIVTTKIEHSAVLEVVKRKKDTRYVEVSEDGRIDVTTIVDENTKLVSITYVNSEIGVIQDIRRIVKTVKAYNPDILIHLDACQATPYFDLHVDRLGVDLLTLNSSKIGGPKGVGVLYKKKGVVLKPIVYGGGQEGGLRSGTENLPALLGFVTALEIVSKNRKSEGERLEKLQSYIYERLETEFPFIRINGSIKHRSPNNVHISIKGIDSQMLVLLFDKEGIAVSVGSACKGATDEPSHVLHALYGENTDWGSMRLSMGYKTKKKEIDRFFKVLKHIVDVYKLG